MRTLRILPLVWLLLAAMTQAQDSYRPPPRIDAAQLALHWISGRYVMPVTCTRRDGSIIHIEQAVVIKPAPQHGPGGVTARATFFGIDAGDVRHCYNLGDPKLVDRRGVLFFHFVSRGRVDTGVSDLRHVLADGEIEFHISGGRLTTRGIGESEGEPDVVSYVGVGAKLRIRLLEPRTDGFRALAEASPPDAAASARLRRLELQVEHPGGASFRSFYLEAWK